MPRPTLTFEETEAKYVMPVPWTGCWLWLGGLMHEYGSVRKTALSSRMIPAHRYFYEHYKGPIPKGLEPDHLCNVKSCVNPNHLEAVTHSINVLRRVQFKPRKKAPLKLICKRGHSIAGGNEYITPSNGVRECWTCKKTRARAWLKIHAS